MNDRPRSRLLDFADACANFAPGQLSREWVECVVDAASQDSESGGVRVRDLALALSAVRSRLRGGGSIGSGEPRTLRGDGNTRRMVRRVVEALEREGRPCTLKELGISWRTLRDLRVAIQAGHAPGLVVTREQRTVRTVRGVPQDKPVQVCVLSLSGRRDEGAR